MATAEVVARLHPAGVSESPASKRAKLNSAGQAGSESLTGDELSSVDWWEWWWNEHPEVAAATQSARLEVALCGGTSSATTVYGTYPMRLFVPQKTASPDANAIWAYTSSHGGGIVSGDKTGLRVVVATGCACVIATQGSTKALAGTVQSGSLLALLPDPIACFENSSFRQVQRVNLLGGASLAAVDWLVPGRVGYGSGERWAFEVYESVLQVAVEGRQVVNDPVRLERGAELSVAEQMGAVHAMGVVLLVGPRLTETCQQAEAVVAELGQKYLRGGAAWIRQPPQSMPSGGRVVASSSRVPGGVMIRFAGESTHAAYSFLQQVLSPLAAQLGAAPYNERGLS